jgi:hypothetical protein
MKHDTTEALVSDPINFPSRGADHSSQQAVATLNVDFEVEARREYVGVVHIYGNEIVGHVMRQAFSAAAAKAIAIQVLSIE